MIHNENSRVKIPALVHLTRLGYDYLSLKQYTGGICAETNIFKSLFWDGVNRINGCSLSERDIDRTLEELAVKLSDDDLGRAFYEILLHGINGLRIIDFPSRWYKPPPLGGKCFSTSLKRRSMIR